MFSVDKNKCFLSTVYKKGGKEFFYVILWLTRKTLCLPKDH